MDTPGGVNPHLAAIVLVGGRASRIGGVIKPLVEFGGSSVLARTAAAAALQCDTVIAVGPVLDDTLALTWVREDPPFSGPAAAIATGVAALPDTAREVLILAGDLAYPERVLAALSHPISPGYEACVLRADDHPQWLAGRYNVAALRGALAHAGALADASARAVLGTLATAFILDEDGTTTDFDTPADLERVRAELKETS